MQFDNTLLKYLVPIKQLQNEHRLQMHEQSQIIELQVGDSLTANEEHRWFLYLLKGKINLLDIDNQSELLQASDERSHHPLFGGGEPKTQLVAQTHCVVARFDKLLFNEFLDQELISGEEQTATEMNEVEANLFNEIMHAFNMGMLKLPSLPIIASKVKNAILNPATAAEDVARIVSADPAMATRLISVANGPLSRGVEPVDSIQSAVVRLGMQTCKELVMSFAIRELFVSQSKILNQRMHDLYDHSIEVASISFALSKQCGLLNPDHMLLAGLLHQIGVIPVLSYIEDTGLIISDDNELDNIIKRFSGAVGGMVIRHWALPGDLLAVVEESTDWQRQSNAKIDACDMVIVAQIYSRLKHQQIDGLPKIDQVPAFKKIFPGKQDADFAIKVFQKANEEIRLVMQLLRM